jgi:ABC-type glutathione transport system ATPase component
MTETVLDISNLAITFDTSDGPVHAVKNVSLQIAKGECLGIVGESGSGKSQTFLCAFGLTAENARVSGSVKFQGVEILGAPRKQLDARTN